LASVAGLDIKQFQHSSKPPTLHASLMKQFNPLNIIILLFLSLPSVGQTNHPTIKELRNSFKTAFKESKEYGNSSSDWSTCNLDSFFYKNDTINLVSDHNYNYHNNCCEVISWVFYSKKNCYITNSQTCREPSSSRVATNKDMYQISFDRDGQFVYLILKGYEGQKIKFRALSIGNLVVGYKGDLTTIKLVRVK
jgi:hypothetical protein